jgi:hypothetical protein
MVRCAVRRFCSMRIPTTISYPSQLKARTRRRARDKIRLIGRIPEIGFRFLYASAVRRSYLETLLGIGI